MPTDPRGELLDRIITDLKDALHRVGALEASEYIAKAGKLLSGDAPAGYVLLADGAGGSEWGEGGFGGGWLVDYAAIIPTGRDAFIPGVVRVVAGGVVNVEGELYVL